MRIIIVLALLMGCAQAQEAEHSFKDKTNLGLFVALSAARTMDVVSTHRMLENPNNHEMFLGPIAHNDASMSAFSAASVAGQIWTAHWLHKRGHHRLERISTIVNIVSTTALVVNNYRLPH